MKWNPFLNALAAFAYIGAITMLLNLIKSYRHDTPDTYIDGMGILSLFVFSAAVMAFLFFYQPLCRLIAGKRAEALVYFLQTLALFGVFTALLLFAVSMQ